MPGLPESEIEQFGEKERITRKLPDDNSFPAFSPEKRAVTKPLFDGHPGRQLTDAEVNEILDFIVVFGYAPSGLSAKMKTYYMKHSRLPERKKLHGSARAGNKRSGKK